MKAMGKRFLALLLVCLTALTISGIGYLKIKADDTPNIVRPKISVEVNGDSVIVTIKKNTTAEGYLIYAKAQGEKKYSFIGQLDKDGFKKRKYTFYGLSKGNYYIKVKAYSGTVASKYSKAKKAVITATSEYKYSDDSSDFVLLTDVVPDAILEIRYYSTYNFVGDRIDGYEEPLAFLTRESAEALKEVSDELKEMGYRLKIFDAYRPQKAVTNFMNWALDSEDTRMKKYFYPELKKSVLFPLGYIDAHSGHSRGSTVDLTLFDMNTEKEVDMGGTFDYFGELSHPDYTGITKEQYDNRMLLREVMTKHGFRPLAEEWWHFTLEKEPYPDTYFTFSINSKNIVNSADEKKAEDFYISEITDDIFDRIKGKSFKDDCTLPREDLRYLHVLHKDLEGNTLEGEMIVNYHIAEDVLDILKKLYEADYPIEKMVLIDEYDADDEASMEDNNSSSFNFRFISHTTRVSKHGLGLAVDINTLYNPYTKIVDGVRIIEPITGEPYLDRDADFPYKIDENDLCYKLFIEKGFEWGGSWEDRKDYQHFEIPTAKIAEWYPESA